MDVHVENKDDMDTSMLKSSFHYTAHKMAQDCAKMFGVEFSRQMIGSVADHVFQTTEVFGRDLELFAKHAKRSKIGPEDVKLLFRNNPGMADEFDNIAHRIEQEKLRKDKAKLKQREAKVKALLQQPEKIPRPLKVPRLDSADNVPFVNDFDNDFEL